MVLLMNTDVSLLWIVVLLLAFCCGRTADADERPSLETRVRSVLERMPTSKWDHDESPESRSQRLDEIASAIAAASRTDHEAAALLTIGNRESTWVRYVREGCNYPDGIPKGASTCDRGTSRTYWQMKGVSCRPGWALPRGSDETVVVFAMCARRRFVGALRRCKGRHPAGDVAGAFAGYRSVDCEWPEGAARAKEFWLRLQQLGGT